MTRAFVLLLLVAVAGACAPAAPRTVTIEIHYSHYSMSQIDVPAGVPITFTIRNDDPIDHEWIVGPADVHEVHRHGTEAVHSGRATEVTVPALSTRTTTLTFDDPGEFAYICHLPGHEEYGMKGVLIAHA